MDEGLLFGLFKSMLILRCSKSTVVVACLGKLVGLKDPLRRPTDECSRYLNLMARLWNSLKDSMTQVKWFLSSWRVTRPQFLLKPNPSPESLTRRPASIQIIISPDALIHRILLAMFSCDISSLNDGLENATSTSFPLEMNFDGLKELYDYFQEKGLSIQDRGLYDPFSLNPQ